jgi:hypothetical protein
MNEITSGITFAQQAQAQQDLYGRYREALFNQSIPLVDSAFAYNPAALNPYMQDFQLPSTSQWQPQTPQFQESPQAPKLPETQRNGQEETTESTAPCDVAEENKALQAYFKEQAKALGLDEKTQAGIQYHTSNGFEVSSVNPAKAKNITEFKPQDAQALNALLRASYEELNSSQSQQEAKTKLEILGNKGEMPDYDASTQSYVTYSAEKQRLTDAKDPKKTGKTNVVERYCVKQNVIRVDAQGRFQVQTRAVQASEVDPSARNFDLVDASTTNSGLSSDAGVVSRLTSTLGSTSFTSAFDSGAKKADFGNPDASKITEALAPLQTHIGKAFGVEGVKLAIQPNSMDGGSTLVLFNPNNNTINIFAPAIRSFLIKGTQAGYTGEKLNQYVLAQLVTQLVHETAHARQYDAIKNPAKYGSTEADKKTIESFTLNKQLYNYPQINLFLKGGLQDYENQPVEKGVKAFERVAKDALLAKKGFETANVTNP